MLTQPDNQTGDLREPWKTIAEQTEPDRFIDLLNWDAFVRGQQNGKMAVDEHRLVFEKWLDVEITKRQAALLERLWEKARWGTPEANEPEYFTREAIQAERQSLKRIVDKGEI